MTPPWAEHNFTDDEITEIEFCRLYARTFHHGTDGHNTKMIVAKMADMLDQIHFALAPTGKPKLNTAIEKLMGHKGGENE